jgi:hypothetical protein
MKYKILIVSLILIIIGSIFLTTINTKKESLTISRKGYLLTCDETSKRTKFSKDLLENIGFDVVIFKCIKNENKVLSNKISMQTIYKIIAEGHDDWGYVFEDDINTLEDIEINDLIQYENISKKFFYLGTCGYDNKNNLYNSKLVNGRKVAMVNGYVRGLHAIAVSKDGAKELLDFSKKSTEIYMDVILEEYAQLNNPNIVRYDLESYIPGHRGIFFQDRDKFPTTI